LTLKALAAGAVKPGFDLPLTGLAIRTAIHPTPYNIVRLDLDSPFLNAVKPLSVLAST